MKRIYALERWCIDCKRCEVACRVFHSKSRDAVRAYRVEGDGPKGRIWVEGTRAASLALNCRHCADPACVQGCISGAMQKHPATGVVAVDQQRCVGCRTCASLCPFGAVRIEEVAGREVAVKCDLCGERLGEAGNPSCVAACPNRALIYVESEGGSHE